MSGPAVVLGVSGSVAAYRACDLARELMRHGFTVRACLTDGAKAFVSEALFEALTGQPCVSDVFEEPERGRMAHIDWARSAAAVVIAPATANVLNKLAAGVADDMLTTIALATTAPLIIAPAMNPTMYASDTVQNALTVLKSRAADVVEPGAGVVACGEQGQGKLATVEEIVASVLTVTSRVQVLAGRHVLITSGPTQEPIDSVRFLSNRSSGKMGAALARAALLMGARVTVVTGPTATPLPNGAEVIRIRTAEEMLVRAREASADAHLIIGAAAVADYRPAEPSDTKIRRTEAELQLRLLPNPDIIAELAQLRPNARVVGFAAEPGIDHSAVVAKLNRKGLFAIAVNDISREDIGFESDANELEVCFADGRAVPIPRMAKLPAALRLLELLA